MSSSRIYVYLVYYTVASLPRYPPFSNLSRRVGANNTHCKIEFKRHINGKQTINVLFIGSKKKRIEFLFGTESNATWKNGNSDNHSKHIRLLMFLWISRWQNHWIRRKFHLPNLHFPSFLPIGFYVVLLYRALCFQCVIEMPMEK